MERHRASTCSGSMGLLNPHECELKCHQNRSPVICNCPWAQILRMKGRLNRSIFQTYSPASRTTKVSWDSSVQDQSSGNRGKSGNHWQRLSGENKHPYSTYRERTWKPRAVANANWSALRNMPHLTQLRSPGWRHRMDTGCGKTASLYSWKLKRLHAFCEAELQYSQACKAILVGETSCCCKFCSRKGKRTKTSCSLVHFPSSHSPVAIVNKGSLDTQSFLCHNCYCMYPVLFPLWKWYKPF